MPSLDVIADRTELRGVVTQPDRPAGRGQRLRATPVKEAALARALEVYEPVHLRAFARELATVEVDAIVVASYGRILPQAVLALPTMGALNVHPSLLPRYRGATPIQAALLAGDTETGVTIMLMDVGMDTGDVVLSERLAIEPSETYGSLHDRLAHFGAELLGRAIDLGERDGVFPHHRQCGEPSVTRPIAKGDLEIDWSWSAKRIVDHVRAYSPQPAARATIEGRPVKVLRAHIARGNEHDALVFPSACGAVVIDELIAPGRSKESGTAFARRSGLR